MPSEALVRVVKSLKRIRRQTFYSIQVQHKSQTLQAPTVLSEHKRLQCNSIWNQLGKTDAIHGNSSECKLDQISRQTAKKTRSVIKSMMNHNFESPIKDNLMAELLPNNDDKEYQDISQDVEDIVKEQSDFEAHALLMITHTVQYRAKSCYNYKIP